MGERMVEPNWKPAPKEKSPKKGLTTRKPLQNKRPLRRKAQLKAKTALKPGRGFQRRNRLVPVRKLGGSFARGRKPLRLKPRKLKINPSAEFLATIAERDGPRCQFPFCSNLAEGRPHRIDNGSEYVLEDCVRLCRMCHWVGNGPHGFKAERHTPFWRRCRDLNVLGEVNREQRAQLWRRMLAEREAADAAAREAKAQRFSS